MRTLAVIDGRNASVPAAPPVPAVDPFDHRWVSSALAALANRIEAGASLDAARDGLFDDLWAWTERYTDRIARRLPPAADADEVRSSLVVAVWEATRRFDPGRWQAWPTLLRRRLEGARVDAVRRGDVLSRRHRQAVMAMQAEVAQREQARGRMLTGGEREAILVAELASRGVGRWVASMASAAPAPVDDVELADPATDPESDVVGAAVADGVRRWLRDDLPADLSSRLLAWWQHRRSDEVPARLAGELRPHLYRVVGLLEPSG